jgi:serine/threonine protein kinase
LNQSVARSELRGTPIYSSPEMIKFKDDDKINVKLETDVWSLGIVIYELITLKRPFKDIDAILNEKIPDFDPNLPYLFKELIKA